MNDEDKENTGGHSDQHRINLATNQLILAVKAISEQSMQQKIGLVKYEAASRNILI